MKNLGRLVQRLQHRLEISPDAVFLHRELAVNVESPGRFFAAAELQKCNLGETTVMNGELTCLNKTAALAVQALIRALDDRNPWNTASAAVVAGGAATVPGQISVAVSGGDSIGLNTCTKKAACNDAAYKIENTVLVE